MTFRRLWACLPGYWRPAPGTGPYMVFGVYRITLSTIGVLLLGEEAVASPSIGNTMARFNDVQFPCPDITPPEVNGFG